MEYPKIQDFVNSRFFGPTSTDTSDLPNGFPSGVYLTREEWLKWQLQAQLKLNEAANIQFAQAVASLGVIVPNPYPPLISTLKQELGIPES